MALNIAQNGKGIVIYYGERIILFCENVELKVEGNSAYEFKGSKKGRLYLTTHRVVFTNKEGTKDPLKSLSMPFTCLSGVELEQPVFGANYIKGSLQAQPNGNWTGKAKFKLVFMNGGAIEFGQAMLIASKMAAKYMRTETPPPYIPYQGPYYQPPPQDYGPPPQGYGFNVPNHSAFSSAPAGDVYMTNAPPPYPGCYAYPPPPPPGNPVPMTAGYGPPPAAPNYQPPVGPGGYPPPPAAPNYQPPVGPGGYPPPPAAVPGYAPTPGAMNGYPPYPNAYGYSAPPYVGGSAEAKAQEAAASSAGSHAYYNPANPHVAYMSTSNGMQPPSYDAVASAPPSYSEEDKKNK